MVLVWEPEAVTNHFSQPLTPQTQWACSLLSARKAHTDSASRSSWSGAAVSLSMV